MTLRERKPGPVGVVVLCAVVVSGEATGAAELTLYLLIEPFTQPDIE